MALYHYVYEKPARKHFQWWYNWAIRSRLAPMKKVAAILKRCFENIITYLAHLITNATSESINAKMQWVKYSSRISQQAELHNGNLLSLWSSRSGTFTH